MKRLVGCLLTAGALLTGVSCGNTVECPDSYGACVAYVEETNARHEACDSEVRLDAAETCTGLDDPQVCIDCIAHYECFTERTQCVEGSIELETVDCEPCSST